MTGPAEPTEADIEREFPAWEVYWSFSLPRARLRDDPAVTVRGEDLLDLRDEMVRAEARRMWGGG